MTTIFLFCALVGGTFLVCQVVMTLLGMGGSDLDGDLLHGISDVGVEHVGDLSHTGVGHDTHDTHHSSSWLFGIISFRTLVAACTVFGLAGMSASTGGMSLGLQLLIAIACGAAAMLGVHWLMRLLYGLGQSGTLRITNAIGRIATVSIPIPARSAGQGKVRLTVQGRLEELAAVNSTDDTLSTGSRVVVVDIVSGNVLSVEPLRETS
jgi:hypothetical protein